MEYAIAAAVFFLLLALLLAVIGLLATVAPGHDELGRRIQVRIPLWYWLILLALFAAAITMLRFAVAQD